MSKKFIQGEKVVRIRDGKKGVYHACPCPLIRYDDGSHDYVVNEDEFEKYLTKLEKALK